jgi:transposase, IS30 family
MGECYEHLGHVDRLAIGEGQRTGLSVRAIARMLARAPSTVSRELKRMGPYWQHYVPAHAFFSALYRRRDSRRGARKALLSEVEGLPPGSPLFAHVAEALREGWSPSQIAGRLRRMDDANALGTVSHETIYTALYALPRGELRRELLGHLRQGRQNRRPRSRGTDRRKGFVTDDIRIAERPEDVAGRLIPGHWEGDLIKGAANRSAVGTLIERNSRLLILARMDGLDAVTTRCAFERAFKNIPAPLRKTLTYDRGTEMARHKDFTQNTGIKVYFADPYSPWQRGSNENGAGGG